MLEIRLFGTLEVKTDGVSLLDTHTRPKDALLLAYLLLHLPNSVSRSFLERAFWPDSSSQERMLIDSLSRLRSGLGIAYRNCIVNKPNRILSLDLENSEVWADIIEFNALLRQGSQDAMERARTSYRELLPHCREAWVNSFRTEYHQKWCTLTEKLAAGAEEVGKWEQAAELWDSVYQDNPFAATEYELQKLLECLAKGEQRERLVTVYQNHWDRLLQRDERGQTRREPLPETTALYERLRQPVSLPQGSDMRFVPPIPLSEILCRDEELAHCTTRLRGMHPGDDRLLTLLGTGGVGKTRLAEELVYRLQNEFSNGSAFVKFGELREGASVSELAAELARQLNIQAQSEQELIDTIQELLGSMSLLMIWDNCEHLHESCAFFAKQLLQNCRRLRLLVTSRHPLQIPGEIREPVEPLETPHAVPKDISGRAAIVGSSHAVQFFVERATTQQPWFNLTDTNAEHIAAICRRLDGLPLAIELAVTWISMYTPKELREKLDTHFWEMTGGAGEEMKREQAMEATIAWSYAQLSPTEQTLFARLSVFAGGWTREAAEAVCVNGGESQSFRSGFKTLQDHCLVQIENAGDDDRRRFRYLNTIRDYAAQRLRELPEADVIARRHRDWCLGFARQADDKLRGPYLYVWLKRMEQESDNLRAALDWACSSAGDSRYGLKLACRMAHFWWVRSYFREGFERFENLLQNAQDFPAGKANAQIRGGTLAEYSNQSETARMWLEDGLAWARQNDSAWETAYALNALGYVNHLYDPCRAMTLLEEGKTLAESIADPWLRALLCSTQGFVRLMREDYAPVRQLLQQGIEQIVIARDPWIEGELYYHLGLLDVIDRDLDSARRRLKRCLPFFEDTGDKLGVCTAYGHLGTVCLCMGDEAAALQHWHDGIQRGKSIGYDRGIALSLDGYALLAAKRGNHACAVQLSHAADAMRARWNTPRGPFWKPQITACLGIADAALGKTIYHSLADDALHLTLAEIEALISTLTLEQGGLSDGR